MSTATLSAATARAQICLSIDEPEHHPCWRRDEAIGPELTVKQLLQSARCYEQEEGDLEQALKRYEQLMDRTGGMPDDPHQADRIRWKIRRLRLLLGKSERPAPTARATAAAPTVDSPPPPPVEVVADPASSAAPRTGGAASCGCTVGASPSEAGAAIGAALVLAGAALRRRREDEEP